MPCSATSRPAVSTCCSTRIPHSRFSAQSEPNEAENVNDADGDEAERLHAELVRRTVVQEPAVADADRRRQSGNGE